MLSKNESADSATAQSAAPTSQITIVVAHDAQRGIGIENRLPWNIPEDLAHFKRTTFGNPIIMGRKTFESIGRPLPGRRNIVVTRNGEWSHEGAERALSLLDAIELVKSGPASIIGGAEIFAAAIEFADRMIVTEIEHTFECDTFFPPIDPEQWEERARDTQATASGHQVAFVTYARRRQAETGSADDESTMLAVLPIRALTRESFASDTAYDIYCAEIGDWWHKHIAAVADRKEDELPAMESARRVIEFLKQFDEKLVAAGLTLEQRHTVARALWTTKVIPPEEGEDRAPTKLTCVDEYHRQRGA
jgi:dihydrofolate reductase